MNEELKVGDFITVVEWLESSDRSWTTEVLEIKARDENLIRCYVHSYCDISTILNLNNVIVRKLSLDFVRACGIKVEEKNPFRAIV